MSYTAKYLREDIEFLLTSGRPADRVRANVRANNHLLYCSRIDRARVRMRPRPAHIVNWTSPRWMLETWRMRGYTPKQLVACRWRLERMQHAAAVQASLGPPFRAGKQRSIFFHPSHYVPRLPQTLGLPPAQQRTIARFNAIRDHRNRTIRVAAHSLAIRRASARQTYGRDAMRIA